MTSFSHSCAHRVATWLESSRSGLIHHTAITSTSECRDPYASMVVRLMKRTSARMHTYAACSRTTYMLIHQRNPPFPPIPRSPPPPSASLSLLLSAGGLVARLVTIIGRRRQERKEYEPAMYFYDLAMTSKCVRVLHTPVCLTCYSLVLQIEPNSCSL